MQVELSIAQIRLIILAYFDRSFSRSNGGSVRGARRMGRNARGRGNSICNVYAFCAANRDAKLCWYSMSCLKKSIYPAGDTKP